MQTIIALVQAIIDHWSDDEKAFPGALFLADDGGIDDGGGYGDPTAAREKPDFVKRDEVGWIPLSKD